MANGECDTCGMTNEHAVGCPVAKMCGCGMPGGDHAASCPVKMPSEVLRDVPVTALARTSTEQRALVRRMTDEVLPNVCRFVCIMCGWDKTLEFDEDEMATMGGDVKTYAGPCPKCGSMTLAPYDKLLGKPITEIARENRRQEFGEAADVFLERAEQKLGEMMTPGKAPPAQAAPAADGRPPGQRDDLPDVSEIDPTTLKPRGA